MKKSRIKSEKYKADLENIQKEFIIERENNLKKVKLERKNEEIRLREEELEYQEEQRKRELENKNRALQESLERKRRIEAAVMEEEADKKKAVLDKIRADFNLFCKYFDELQQRLSECDNLNLENKDVEVLNKTLKMVNEFIKKGGNPDHEVLHGISQHLDQGLSVATSCLKAVVNNIAVQKKNKAMQQAEKIKDEQELADKREAEAAKIQIERINEESRKGHFVPPDLSNQEKYFMELKIFSESLEIKLKALDPKEQLNLASTMFLISTFEITNKNLPINHQKFQLMLKLLSGRSIPVNDNVVSTRNDSNLDFALKYILSRRILKVVNSNSIHLYSSLIAALWSRYPNDLGKLFHYSILDCCPFLIPSCPTKLPSQSHADFNKSRGMKAKVDGSDESYDVYLNRMAITAQVYGRVATVRMDNGAYVLGPAFAWSLLATILSLQPSNVTPIILHNYLIGAGYRLQELYKKLFTNLMVYIFEIFLPKLVSIIHDDAKASLYQFKSFLESYRKKGTLNTDSNSFLFKTPP